jgi:hypothetical protein
MMQRLALAGRARQGAGDLPQADEVISTISRR